MPENASPVSCANLTLPLHGSVRGNSFAIKKSVSVSLKGPISFAKARVIVPTLRDSIHLTHGWFCDLLKFIAKMTSPTPINIIDTVLRSFDMTSLGCEI